MVIQIWIFGRHLLKNEQNESIISKKIKYLLLMIKRKLSSEDWNVGKLISTIMSLTACS